jgi:hypothetical protein
VFRVLVSLHYNIKNKRLQVADLKSQQIRDSYEDLLTKGSGTAIEDGDGVPFADLADLPTYLKKTGGDLTGLLRATAGINFNASGGDTLDEYEVGTFTPFWSDSGGGLASYSVQSGSYVRIGNHVFLTLNLRSDKGALSGDISIGGLPFSLTGFGGFVTLQRRWGNDLPNIKVLSSGVVYKQATNSTALVPLSADDMLDTDNSRNWLSMVIIGEIS